MRGVTAAKRADSDGNGLPDLNVFYYDGLEIPADIEAEITKNQYPTLTTSEVNPPDVYSSEAVPGGSWPESYNYASAAHDVRCDRRRQDGSPAQHHVSSGAKTREFYETNSTEVFHGLRVPPPARRFQCSRTNT
jgi:hypothetical protein